eukprot:COSAG04_NODE_8407_length_980_cov_1.959137_1_plen_148_part_00
MHIVTAERVVELASGWIWNFCLGLLDTQLPPRKHGFERAFACSAQWAGAVRAAVKQRQQELWDQQQASLQQVLSRLDPDGDGVVDQDEFTTWAQQQAVRVELWERQIGSAMAELQAKVESAVDQEELAQRLANIEARPSFALPVASI